MTKINLDKIGSQTALFIGLPLGTIFSLGVLVISLFPMFDLGLAIIGGKLFWHPIIWAGLIPATFIFLLWAAGKKNQITFRQKVFCPKNKFFVHIICKQLALWTHPFNFYY